MNVNYKVKLLTALSLILFTLQAHSALVSGPDIIAAVSIQEDSPTNTHQQGFDENQSVLINRNIQVDQGIILAGTLVSSHIIFLNTANNQFAADLQTWEFDTDILGIMSDRQGRKMARSNDLFAPFNDYFTSQNNSLPFKFAGLESNSDYYSFNGRFLDLYMQVTEPGDWIRVLTVGQPPVSQVPLPGAVWLFGSCLLGLASMRRKN